MEKNFQNSLEFKPERFMVDSEATDAKMDRFVYYPFGLGPRNCIGQNFAQIESIVLLVKFLQRFDFKIHRSTDSTPMSYVQVCKQAQYILTPL